MQVFLGIVQSVDLLFEVGCFVKKANNTFIESKVPKWDNLVLRSADFYFSIVINFLQRAAAIFILERKEGEIGK